MAERVSGSGSWSARVAHAGKAVWARGGGTGTGIEIEIEIVNTCLSVCLYVLGAAVAAAAWAGERGDRGVGAEGGHRGAGRPWGGHGGWGRLGQRGNAEGTLGFAWGGHGGHQAVSPLPSAPNSPPLLPSGPCWRLTAGPDPAGGHPRRHHGQEKQIGQEPEGQVLPPGQGDG